MVNMEERVHLDKCNQEIDEYFDNVVEAPATNNTRTSIMPTGMQILIIRRG
jgi:hypothetical protein